MALHQTPERREQTILETVMHLFHSMASTPQSQMILPVYPAGVKADYWHFNSKDVILTAILMQLFDTGAEHPHKPSWLLKELQRRQSDNWLSNPSLPFSI